MLETLTARDVELLLQLHEVDLAERRVGQSESSGVSVEVDADFLRGVVQECDEGFDIVVVIGDGRRGGGGVGRSLRWHVRS